jgi:hypothetical protein
MVSVFLPVSESQGVSRVSEQKETMEGCFGCVALIVIGLIIWALVSHESCGDSGPRSTASCEELRVSCKKAIEQASTPEQKVEVLRRCDELFKAARCY